LIRCNKQPYFGFKVNRLLLYKILTNKRSPAPQRNDLTNQSFDQSTNTDCGGRKRLERKAPES